LPYYRIGRIRTTEKQVNTIDNELIERLADAVAQRLEPSSIPLEHQVWSLAKVATYLGKHVETVRETMACLPSFPPAIRLPARNGARSHALYNAAEVIKWAHSYREKR
jgi:hypothetical protein